MFMRDTGAVVPSALILSPARLPAVLLMLGLLLFSARAPATDKSYLALGYQALDWQYQDQELKGKGWQLQGQYALTDHFAFTGRVNRVGLDEDVADLNDWQLGGRLFTSASGWGQLGLEYRHIGMTLKSDSDKAEEEGGRGELQLYFNLSGLKQRAVLELSGGQTAYKKTDLNFGSLGLRLYPTNRFSLALHVEIEKGDWQMQTGSRQESELQRLVFSIREEK